MFRLLAESKCFASLTSLNNNLTRLFNQGTMYIVMSVHVFVCSACAGIHREMNHKVKGISMCVFNEAELKDITDNGNAVSDRKLSIQSCY